jgi:hypothetical protein
MMQDAVEQLMQLGPFPEMEITFERVKTYEVLIVAIQRPVTNEEAIALCHIFQDHAGFHELEWSLVTAIESAPDWPIKTCLTDANNMWIELLRVRARNAGFDV